MNIYDIAKMAGVSPTTVSRVLNGSANVKASTREKVMATIEGRGYVPSALARSPSTGGSQTIAFIVPDIENPFFSQVLHGITDRAAECNYNVFMFGTDECCEREHSALESLNAEMIKGIIIIPVSEEDKKTQDMLECFERRNIPVVLLDRDTSGACFDGVFSEDSAGSSRAVECFIDEGHKKIAIITGPVTSRPGRERLEGYKKALLAHGLEINPDYIVDGNFREEESYNAMQKLMALDEKPTAILTSNNMTTLGCLKYMKEKGLCLGRDISLIGYDDIPELTYTDIALTAITRPNCEMGCEAMNLLEQRFLKKTTPDCKRGVVHRSIIKTDLVRRGSEKFPF